jgi:integrase
VRVKLTQGFVSKVPPPTDKDRELYWDDEQPLLALVVTANGHRSWCIQYRNSAGRSKRLGPPVAGMSLMQARQWARRMVGVVSEGRDPLAEKRAERKAADDSLKAIIETFLRIEGPKLRSAAERRRMFDRYLPATLVAKPITSIARSDLVRVLDDVRENNGQRTAELLYAYLSKVLRWHESRTDGWRAPLISGAGGEARKRDRTLSDDEIRRVWRACDEMGAPFGPLVQMCLLTATRRREVVEMKRNELGVDLSEYGVQAPGWLVPASRVKNKVDFLVPLSRKAQAVLSSIPNIGPAVFTFNGAKPLGDVSAPLGTLHKRSGTSGWSMHDLRRTARTLMSRAKVPVDEAERALGHTIKGPRANYDLHDYAAAKLAAFEALASLIDRIVDPRENVVTLTSREAAV